MPDKLTDNEIVKALECCKGDIADCPNCPYDSICGNHDNKMLIDTLNLINRQKANLDDKEDAIQYADKEIKRLNAEVEELTAKISVRDKLLDIAETKINATENHCQYLRKLYNEKVCLCEEQKAEIERLRNHIQEGIDLAKQIPEMMELVKAEAYREFAERLKIRSHTIKTADGIVVECTPLDYIDRLLKELVGEDDG